MEIICAKSGHQIQWDGITVWVNSKESGSSIGRFNKRAMDVHTDAEEQMRTGEQCLECTRDCTLKTWRRFQELMKLHYGAIAPDAAIPRDLEEEESKNDGREHL